MTPADYARARRLLMRRDPVMRALLRRIGPCRLAASQHADPFEALVQAIVWQQLSWKAALTIYRRFQAIFNGARCPTPRELVEAPEAPLRAAGLSRPKIRYLKDLAARVAGGSLPLAALESMSDEDVIAALTEVKGIGRWSAEMFLIFKLHRPDILPVDDLAIQNAIRRAYRLRKPPSAKRMLQMGERWRPYRSVASWYLWESLDKTPVAKTDTELTQNEHGTNTE
jgi:DNA-3-methyladenine glycosylase II